MQTVPERRCRVGDVVQRYAAWQWHASGRDQMRPPPACCTV
jgi:hypothetical protein